MTRGRVLAAMSGGVDSSVAAMLLKREGWDVVGVTMDLFGGGTAPEGKCCSYDDRQDARRVCDALGIPFYVLNMKDAFREMVVDPFIREYASGRTPNPCTLCNERLKFGALMRKADELGAEMIATGHYAIIRRGPGPRCRLLASSDARKDQSYFLFSLDEQRLSRILFPVGELAKTQVRALAAEAGLPISEKAESQDICFVPDGDYGAFLARNGIEAPEGDFVDTHGKVLGRHRGVTRYTVGQRKGLGVSAPEPLFVVRIDGLRNRVVLGKASESSSTTTRVDSASFVAGDPPAAEFRALARIRYRHPGVLSTVSVLEAGRSLSVRFDEPQRGVAPGQALVLYDGDEVVGGGWIACASD
ncbi:MAG TPA: tRNA 2-thiouridine(34) synthase MnmA [Candidatus Deferrimicrobiaceae bacterium]|jgi:tRNA-specific 2-thiouridylase